MHQAAGVGEDRSVALGQERADLAQVAELSLAVEAELAVRRFVIGEIERDIGCGCGRGRCRGRLETEKNLLTGSFGERQGAFAVEP
jgi:hypothetical protein